MSQQTTEIPFMVDATRTPVDFKQLDPAHVEACATRTRCGVCGRRIRRGPVAFIGPDDGRRCFGEMRAPIVIPTRYSSVVKLQEARQALATPDGPYTTSPTREIVMPVQRTTLPRLCAHCGVNKPKRSEYRFCSSACSNAATGQQRAQPIEYRFWSKVDKNGPIIRPELGSCWVWTGRVDRRGYGVFDVDYKDGYDQKIVNANKVALEWQLGRHLLPDNGALHKCDNPPCVRNDGPNSHLFEGTRAINNADMAAKGRSTRARFSDAEKLEIIRLRTVEGMSWLGLSRQFGIARSVIKRIVQEGAPA